MAGDALPPPSPRKRRCAGGEGAGSVNKVRLPIDDIPCGKHPVHHGVCVDRTGAQATTSRLVEAIVVGGEGGL